MSTNHTDPAVLPIAIAIAGVPVGMVAFMNVSSRVFGQSAWDFAGPAAAGPAFLFR